MNMVALKTAFDDFASTAAPYLVITDEAHYEETLELVESLLEEVGEDDSDPRNHLIELLSKAIEEYEDIDKEVVAFDKEAMALDSDVSVLRVLMNQHQLGVNDLPEIGSKSLISRILSGDRNLTKTHIQQLSARFGLSPAVFF